ncbi:MAG: ferrochelatase [Chloroflexota bacterium]|nr:ferrochelatase [Chloroflexota bacterium]
MATQDDGGGAGRRPPAVLMLAYGGPDKLEDVGPYLLDVRHHRPTSPELIHEISERYRQIGGRSPILELTEAQATALQTALNQNEDGDEDSWQVFVGMRHWHPFIKDVLAEMEAAGYDRTVGLVMAPHYSRMSIGAYFQRAADAGSPIEIAGIERWHLLPGYLEAMVDRVRAALERFPAEVRDRVPVLFTAHSLPERILTWDDPYPRELRETTEALGRMIAPQPSRFAYQSAAMTPDPWLGPDAGEVIEQIAAEGGKHLLIAPIGFVCEHVEILFDIDVEFKRQAEELGVHLERIEMLNDHPTMIDGLAGLVRERATAAGWTG